MDYGLKILTWDERKQWDRAFGHAWATNGTNDEAAAYAAWNAVLSAATRERRADLVALRASQSTSQPVNQLTSQK